MPVEATTTLKKILYEQPLNEPMRVSLRLEHLFKQLEKYKSLPDPESSKHAVILTVKILDVVNRPDLKSKLVQTLRQHATALGQIEHYPHVDQSHLNHLLNQLDLLISNFHRQQGRIGENLRKNEFLNNIRLRLGNPGGACIHSMPPLALWLKKSDNERAQDLMMWDSTFTDLQQAIETILYLARNSSEAKEVHATNGFYQQTLDPSLSCEIIRVNVPIDYNIFPEFSVGKHRFSIRFLKPSYQGNGHPTQSNQDLPFELTCCIV